LGLQVSSLSLLYGWPIQRCLAVDGTTDAAERYETRLGSAGRKLCGASPSREGTGEALKRYPDLTVEGYVSDPGFNDTERQHLIRTMKLAGFPACAKVDQLGRFAKPIWLPEFGA
jgi:hypothetical protein